MPQIDEAGCRTWRQLAFRFARHWGCTESDAEDVAQQALLSALTVGASAFTHGWFYVTTRRLSSRVRARARRECLVAEFPPAPCVWPDDSSLLLREIEALRALKPAEHELLRELLKGRSHAEIAGNFGWHPKSVGVRAQRLVRKIQSVVLNAPTR